MMLRKVGMAAAVNASALPVTLVAQIAAGNALGKETYGDFSLSISIASVLSLLLCFGLHNTLMVVGGRALGADAPERFWVYRFGARKIVATIAFAFAIASPVFPLEYFGLPPAVLIGTTIVSTLWAFQKLDVASLRLRGKLVAPLLLEVPLRESAILVGSVVLIITPSGYLASSDLIIALLSAVILAYFAGLIYSHICLKLIRNSGEWCPRAGANPMRTLIREGALHISARMGLVSVSQILLKRADILLLGIFSSSSTVAEYVVLTKVCDTCGLGLTAANVIISPKVSKYLEQNRRSSLQTLINMNNKFAFGLALLLASGLAAYGIDLIELLFFELSDEASLVLFILLAGQLINTAAGNTTAIASIGGEHDLAMRIMVVASLLKVLICLVVIPYYGIVGSAIVSVLIVLGWNVAMAFVCKRKILINPTIFNKNGKV